MDKLGLLLCALSAVCLFGAALCIFYAHHVLRALDRMLDAALRGEWSETAYDESALSRLEARFARYLSSGALARRRIDEDRARIKELIGDISHQTKTPLANISLYTELLAEQPLPEKAHAMTLQIASQSDKLSFLIASLVKLSRLESGVVQTHPEPARLQELLAAVQDEFAPRAAEKGVALTVEPCALWARFDPKWTREALGIGLSLAREIASQQGGYIRLASEAGQGAVFSLYLPRAEEM